MAIHSPGVTVTGGAGVWGSQYSLPQHCLLSGLLEGALGGLCSEFSHFCDQRPDEWFKGAKAASTLLFSGSLCGYLDP